MWNEQEHPRDKNGQFVSGNAGTAPTEEEAQKMSAGELKERLATEYPTKRPGKTKNPHPNLLAKRNQRKKRKRVSVSKAEYAMVMSETATNLRKDDDGKSVLTKHIRNKTYTMTNNGFGNYGICFTTPITSKRGKK